MNCPLQTHASCSRDAGDVAQPWAALSAKSVQIWSLGITLGFKDSFRNFLIMIESYTAAPQVFRLRRMWLSTLNSTRSSGKAMLQQRPPTCTRSQYSEYAGGCHCRWTVPTIAFSLTIPLSSSNTKTILLHLLGFTGLTGLTTFSILLGFATMALQSPHLSPRGAQLRLPKRDTKSPLSILGDIGYRN